MNTVEKEKKSYQPQWSLGSHRRQVSSPLGVQPGLQLWLGDRKTETSPLGVDKDPPGDRQTFPLGMKP